MCERVIRGLDRRADGQAEQESGLRLQRRDDTYEDLTKAGVIDPAKVVTVALQNAASVATLLLTTEALVSVMPEKKKGGGGGDEMGGMGDMDF